MGKDSKIQWTHHTWNPVRGCARISKGCDHCYAEAMSARNPRVLGQWGPDAARVFAAESYWRQPVAWNAAAREAGEVHRVFVASLADIFEGAHGPDGERRDGPRPDYLPMLARMRETFAPLTNLRVLALTKRPWNAAAWAAENGWPETWWFGFTAEDQAALDERAPWAYRVMAPVRFISAEPLVGPLDLMRDPLLLARVDWVIAGGESGSGARPMHPDWVRRIRDQAEKARVCFHFKQWGAWVTEQQSPEDIVLPGTSFIHWGDSDPAVYHVGKHAAGRLLDGREWNEVPHAR